VSRRIAELEDQLGLRLIERSTRRLRLTDAGSEVLEHARRTVELSAAVNNVASNLVSHVSGTLRLASPPSISDTLLAPIVGHFRKPIRTFAFKFSSPIESSTTFLKVLT
jgi:DNA-binding transcriptional LysR family regulator